MNQAPSSNSGIYNAIAAYVMWGIAPLYFKLIEHISASEIMIHRIVWACLLLFLLLCTLKKLPELKRIVLNQTVMLKLVVTAGFIGSNWYLFIWAVNNGHILDASLGYYINPLLNVALGMMFLGERLRKLQWVAIALAVVGVMVQVVALGTLPIISLALAGTFGLYGLLRKKLAVDSFVGLFIESMMLLPIALIYWQFFLSSPSSNMFENPMDLNLLLMFAGVVTTAPLLCFTAAAKRIALSLLGMFQYIGPSIMFCIAVFYFGEPIESGKLITFGFIWIALLIFTFDSLKSKKRT